MASNDKFYRNTTTSFALTAEVERILVGWAPIMVYSYVISIRKVTPFRDGRPGHDCVLNFERRHSEKLRKRRRVSLSKVK